jgi:hypothetical protein
MCNMLKGFFLKYGFPYLNEICIPYNVTNIYIVNRLKNENCNVSRTKCRQSTSRAKTFSQQGRQSCQHYAPAALNPKEISEAERTPCLLNEDRKITSLENFQSSYWESKSEPPFSWFSTSPKCGTLAPILPVGTEIQCFELPFLWGSITKYC